MTVLIHTLMICGVVLVGGNRAERVTALLLVIVR